MRFARGFEGVLGPALVALVFAGYPTVLRAQTTSATVSGSVQDSQGGVLPGVTVTMTSRTQGNVLTGVTDAGGRFVFPIVRPDTYTLQATLPGFKTAERTNLNVNANDKLSTGALTLEIGQLSEEVSVSSPVTPLQSASGERSFTLQSETLKNIANNGRALFNFATLVPGALSQNTGNTELGSVSGFTVNGQRPNSNNITIDGVANIDTGDNGGNMATTNIDAVAEFKILTNAYQAEYGRAVGGQLQVVTKSGSQDFHGSGYWYGRRSAWDANSYLNKRETPEVPKSKTARNDSGYTFGGPVAFPGFNTEKKKLFFFWSQEFQRRTNPATVHQTRVPTALEQRGDFSQSVDSSGNPFPFIRDFSTGLPCSASDTRGCFQDGGVLGRIPANRLYAPGLAALKIFPQPNFSGGSGLNFTSQDPDSPKRREEMLRMDFQATSTWRVTGRYMNNKEDILQAYGTTWAGNGSDQLPTPTLFVHPGSNYMLSATGTLNSSTSLELSWGRAANSLNYQLQQQQLFRANAGVSSLPLLFPSAVQADYVPWFVFRGGRTGNAGQYQTDRGPVHQPERHARRHRQPDESVGSAFLEGRVLLPAQLQAAEHLRQLQQPDRLPGQLEQPLRHGIQLRERGDRRVQFLPAGLEVRASRMELQEHRVVRAGQLEAQWPFHARLRRAVLLTDTAVGHDAAVVEFPAGQVRFQQCREALYAGVRRRSAGRGLRAPWDGPDAHHRRYDPDVGQYR